ncbi:helix-turn-helix domain containing protein [Shewanella algae]|nr:helix-turn-helix domain containing protein [Shewanella algae]
MHKTRDKNECRRLNAILLLVSGHTVTEVSGLIAAARTSINRWVSWYTECGIEGLESSTKGRSCMLPNGVVDQIIRLNATAPRLSAALRDFLANRHTQSYDFV